MTALYTTDRHPAGHGTGSEVVRLVEQIGGRMCKLQWQAPPRWAVDERLWSLERRQRAGRVRRRCWAQPTEGNIGSAEWKHGQEGGGQVSPRSPSASSPFRWCLRTGRYDTSLTFGLVHLELQVFFSPAALFENIAALSAVALIAKVQWFLKTMSLDKDTEQWFTWKTKADIKSLFIHLRLPPFRFL